MATLRCLPIVAFDFATLPPGVRRSTDTRRSGFGTRASIRSRSSNARPPASAESLCRETERVALDAYRALGCRDWCRVDVRVDRFGVPNVVELNPLPGIIPDPAMNSCFPKAARVAGYGYDELISRSGAARLETHYRTCHSRRPRGGGGQRVRVVILYDPGADDWTAEDVAGVMQAVDDHRPHLRCVEPSGPARSVRHDMRWFNACRRADLVFNLCEGVRGVAQWEDHVVGTLELAGIAYTGCGRGRRRPAAAGGRQHDTPGRLRERQPLGQSAAGSARADGTAAQVSGDPTCHLARQVRIATCRRAWC